jgi:hypothetical protein
MKPQRRASDRKRRAAGCSTGPHACNRPRQRPGLDDAAEIRLFAYRLRRVRERRVADQVAIGIGVTDIVVRARMIEHQRLQERGTSGRILADASDAFESAMRR